MTERDPILGRRLADRYAIGTLLARGGMARVYRARDERLERDVAIKVLSQPYADDPAFTDRFLAEARAAASLTHPSLVHVYDSGSDGDAHYIVMELLDRHRSLRQEIEARGRLVRDDVRRIGRELLDGLGAVHARGLVHSDVKAGNVMLGPGPAKLIDFGIATAPHDGTTGTTSIGSLPYMSPEQLRGRAMSPASDLFSLGVVLYEALTGTAPYQGRTPQELSDAHRSPPPRPAAVLGVPGDHLDDAIMQALRPDPDDRFSSAAAMAAALVADTSSPREAAGSDDETHVMRTATEAGGPAPPPTRAPERPERAAPRRMSPGAIAVTLGLLAVAVLVGTVVVMPLLDLAREGGASPSPTAAPSVAPDGGTVVIPNLVGSSTADAIEAARQAGLDWTVWCEEDASRPAGIIDQEPPAGTEVARGSPFNLYSARFADCD